MASKDPIMSPKSRSSTKQPTHTGSMGKFAGSTKTQYQPYNRSSSNSGKKIDGQLK